MLPDSCPFGVYGNFDYKACLIQPQSPSLEVTSFTYHKTSLKTVNIRYSRSLGALEPGTKGRRPNEYNKNTFGHSDDKHISHESQKESILSSHISKTAEQEAQPLLPAGRHPQTNYLCRNPKTR